MGTSCHGLGCLALNSIAGSERISLAQPSRSKGWSWYPYVGYAVKRLLPSALRMILSC